MGGSVDLVNERTHRTLAFMSALTERGAAPTTDAVEEFYWWPNPMSEGALIDREVWGDESGERASWYLVRLGLATVETQEELDDADGKVRLTPQGRAMLQHLDSLRARPTEIVEMYVDPSDQFAYPLVLLKLSQVGPGLMVDPYCRAEQLGDLLRFEGTNRVLLSTASANQREAVALMLARAEDRHLEVRRSTAIHDRYFIPDAGPVLMLGMSLNGVGKKVGAIAELGDEASSLIRKAHEKLWEEALVIEPTTRSRDPGLVPETPVATDGAGPTEVDPV